MHLRPCPGCWNLAPLRRLAWLSTPAGEQLGYWRGGMILCGAARAGRDVSMTSQVLVWRCHEPDDRNVIDYTSRLPWSFYIIHPFTNRDVWDGCTEMSYVWDGCTEMSYVWDGCTEMSYVLDGCTEMSYVWDGCTEMSYVLDGCTEMSYVWMGVLRRVMCGWVYWRVCSNTSHNRLLPQHNPSNQYHTTNHTQ